MTYTDYVGNPIAAGDFICYGVKSGSSAVNMVLAKVHEVVPIHPIEPNNPDNTKGFTADDIAKGKADYAARRIASRWVRDGDKPVGLRVRDDSKAYLLKVKRLKDGWGDWYRGWGDRPLVDSDKITTIHNVTNVVVVNPADEDD